MHSAYLVVLVMVCLPKTIMEGGEQKMDGLANMNVREGEQQGLQARELES